MPRRRKGKKSEEEESGAGGGGAFKNVLGSFFGSKGPEPQDGSEDENEDDTKANPPTEAVHQIAEPFGKKSAIALAQVEAEEDEGGAQEGVKLGGANDDDDDRKDGNDDGELRESINPDETDIERTSSSSKKVSFRAKDSLGRLTQIQAEVEAKECGENTETECRSIISIFARLPFPDSSRLSHSSLALIRKTVQVSIFSSSAPGALPSPPAVSASWISTKQAIALVHPLLLLSFLPVILFHMFLLDTCPYLPCLLVFVGLLTCAQRLDFSSSFRLDPRSRSTTFPSPCSDLDERWGTGMIELCALDEDEDEELRGMEAKDEDGQIQTFLLAHNTSDRKKAPEEALKILTVVSSRKAKILSAGLSRINRINPEDVTKASTWRSEKSDETPRTIGTLNSLIMAGLFTWDEEAEE
ncbi:hypothetical protein GUITHDRAFT_133232 [Guillardia theta CCMP2712]|uniref:Uncharacterized protein n=1 Tax=Guillardia theta (strain CCMP2712) TaxID=905079 RepID=L1JWT1_GUITC|nr:hypothetical protein GUITHDRAFT_133232 [Guillardia theta CCMP2712]EKX52797.1 hypothetical protein GUITHDRAFT_133232 [Guillardia theta CCMP2712]|eukprot:XP_005839777.1 hypothetical protein GUITHDRAFT_133232 [Guillardia theta CCMP2712]